MKNVIQRIVRFFNSIIFYRFSLQLCGAFLIWQSSALNTMQTDLVNCVIFLLIGLFFILGSDFFVYDNTKITINL